MEIAKTVGPVTRQARKLLKLKYCGAVIVAAGSGTRMQGTDKIMADLGGKRVIRRAVEAFQECDAIKEIVLVTRPELVVTMMSLMKDLSKVTAVVAGGKDRPASVQAGLNALSDKVKLAAIHDGARPLVSWQLIDRAVRAAGSYGAAVPCVPVKDTVKITAGGVVSSTPDRAGLQAAQTPQVFDFDLLRGALTKAAEEGAAITDDASAVERLGMRVKVVAGEERNIKITTPLDMKIAELFLQEAP